MSDFLHARSRPAAALSTNVRMRSGLREFAPRIFAARSQHKMGRAGGAKAAPHLRARFPSRGRAPDPPARKPQNAAGRSSTPPLGVPARPREAPRCVRSNTPPRA